MMYRSRKLFFVSKLSRFRKDIFPIIILVELYVAVQTDLSFGFN